jgi:hypothetical protein
MKRTKRFTLRRVALGLAVAAVLAPAAQAKPTSSQPSVEIPYLSQGVGVTHMDFDQTSQASGTVSSEIAYLSHGNVSSPPDFWNYDPKTGAKVANTSPGLSADQLAQLYGGDAAIAPDDLAMTRPSNAGSPSVAETSGSWEPGTGTVSGFAIALVLLAVGSALLIRHNRKTRLSPA